MFTKTKAFAVRVRVRLRALFVMSLVVLPELLDQLGVIDLRPALAPVLGAHTELAIVIITITLGVMRPMVHFEPKPCPPAEVIVTP